MGTPIDNRFRHIYEDPNVRVNNNPLAAPQKPFDINATERSYKSQKDFKKNKKKDKNGKDIEEDEDEEEKPLPRPMGL